MLHHRWAEQAGPKSQVPTVLRAAGLAEDSGDSAHRHLASRKLQLAAAGGGGDGGGGGAAGGGAAASLLEAAEVLERRRCELWRQQGQAQECAELRRMAAQLRRPPTLNDLRGRRREARKLIGSCHDRADRLLARWDFGPAAGSGSGSGASASRLPAGLRGVGSLDGGAPPAPEEGRQAAWAGRLMAESVRASSLQRRCEGGLAELDALQAPRPTSPDLPRDLAHKLSQRHNPPSAAGGGAAPPRALKRRARAPAACRAERARGGAPGAPA